MQFNIEQVALFPPDPEKAIELLSAMGMSDWVHDMVTASGNVHGAGPWVNKAHLAFNYQALHAARELETLNYPEGVHWMRKHPPCVSHLGMHCTAAELSEWREFFAARNIPVAQEVNTVHHTNPAIAGKRWYNYVIFETRPILGVDIKFIVRKDAP